MEDVAAQAKKNQKSMKMTEGAMLALGAGAIIMGERAVRAFIDISRESLQAASDAQEVEGKFNVVFQSISDESNAAFTSLADDFDLASSTAQELLGNTGDLLTGFGLSEEAALSFSEQTNRLALDLASFTNAQGGAAAVSKALTSAYAGERDSLKTYGIVIREADVKARQLKNAQEGLIFASEAEAKTFATLALATEQSKNAIGDYARTADSTANVQKTLDEQIKRSKENWGAFLNEGITPVRKAFRDFLKETNDAMESESNISNAILGRDADVAKALEDLREIEERQRKIFETQASGSGDDFARVELRNTQKRIAQLEAEKEILDRINSIKSRGQIISDLEKKAADEAQKRNEISLSSAERLEELRVSKLSTSEKEIESLNSQIDKWAEFRDVAGVQQLINELASDRNELLKEQAELTELVLTAEQIAGDERLSTLLMEEAAILARDKRIIESEREKAESAKETADEIKAAAEESKMAWEDYAEIGLGAVVSGFQEIGKALVEGELGIADFGKLFLNAASQILSAIGAELAGLATVQLLLGNFAGAATGYLQSGAAFLASGVVQGASAAFAEGGSFTTDGPQTIQVGDNIGGRERVTVEPVSSTGRNVESSGSSGNGSGNMTLNIDGTQFKAWLQDELDNGEFSIPRRLVV